MALVQTNIVRFALADERLGVAEFVAGLRARGVLLGGQGGRLIRAVTHYGIGAADVARAVAAARDVLSN
jgi:threonine aldolase